MRFSVLTKAANSSRNAFSFSHQLCHYWNVRERKQKLLFTGDDPNPSKVEMMRATTSGHQIDISSGVKNTMLNNRLSSIPKSFFFNLEILIA